MRWLLAAGCALLGGALGPYLAYVAAFFPDGEGRLDRLACGRCALAWRMRDAGRLRLGARCGGCGHPLGPGGPAPWLAGGLFFGAVTWAVGPAPALPAYLYLAAAGVALAVADLRVRRLPASITQPSYPVAAALLGLAALASGNWPAYGRALCGMAASFGAYLVLYLLYRGGLGFGDVMLAGILGLYLGWLGWDALVTGAVAGLGLGGLLGAALVLTRRRETHFPLGPFLLAGALVGILWGRELAALYQGAARPG
ncbi:prepilin peptidase [Carbonactinospora thermoautotrophica]|uniref:prepilin peptidase n=1 Tax=Carbonactinospora thermoautotrophica TaxID=1469144 RepID=UPI002270317A|nr:A24 family peptidase [Carbonactinospora thermoautotrophica]MCX9193022.1 prepilin peptidase [Carbonactinospora thermoautotrophica]